MLYCDFIIPIIDANDFDFHGYSLQCRWDDVLAVEEKTYSW